ncbi:zinc finger protein ubi-d4 [Culicoides brevitarsis]|uniref:zinc finger protein ubi-d4 n=1 Tax=Culicoides brevitarsis TaxID=469753 RepID=UPI00307B47C7
MESLGVNIANLQKIEAFLSGDSYKEMLENSETFNTRLCIERKLRMPFLDPQTGIAQNNSQLFMKRRQRMPGMKTGQIYSYPAARWRKARRQYLTNPRPFGKLREITSYEDESRHSLDNSTSLGAIDTDSKDSQRDDNMPKEWFYDDYAEMHDMGDFDEPEPESDGDYEEPYHFKRQRRRGRGGRSRANEYSPRARGRGSRGPRGGRSRGGPSQAPGFMDNSMELPGSSTPQRNRNNRQSMPGPPSTQFTPGGGSTTFIPSGYPTGGDAATDPAMPVLMPEQKLPEDPDDKLLPPAHYIRKPEKGKAPPSPYCDFCLGDARENKKTMQPEDLVSCSDCGRSGHPSCLQFTKNMTISVKKYRWQCIECKYCSICGTSDNDDQLLFCDDCDRGYHMYCLSPRLANPPEGSWSCKLCNEEFHGGKKD